MAKLSFKLEGFTTEMERDWNDIIIKRVLCADIICKSSQSEEVAEKYFCRYMEIMENELNINFGRCQPYTSEKNSFGDFLSKEYEFGEGEELKEEIRTAHKKAKEIVLKEFKDDLTKTIVEETKTATTEIKLSKSQELRKEYNNIIDVIIKLKKELLKTDYFTTRYNDIKEEIQELEKELKELNVKIFKLSLHKTEKSDIENILAMHDLKIGCFDNKILELENSIIEELKDNLRKEIICNMYIETNFYYYVLELEICDNEVDFKLTPLRAYCKEYGYSYNYMLSNYYNN